MKLDSSPNDIDGCQGHSAVNGARISHPPHTPEGISPLGRRSRQRLTVFLPTSLLDRLRNAVYWTGTRPLAQIIGDALEQAVTDMEQANGGTFPQRLAPLKPGRPRRRP
jgi:hypothetical protein